MKVFNLKKAHEIEVQSYIIKIERFQQDLADKDKELKSILMPIKNLKTLLSSSKMKTQIVFKQFIN